MNPSGSAHAPAHTVTPAEVTRRLPVVSAWTPVLLALLGMPLLLHGAGASPSTSVVVLDLLYVPLCVAGLVLALSAARRAGPGRTGRGPWRWVALAFAFRLWGEAWWAWLELARGAEPFPSVADVGFVAFYPALAVALLRFPTPARRRTHGSVLLLDAVTVAAGACVLLWEVLVSDLLQAGVTSPAVALTLGYTVGDVVLVSVAARAALLGTQRGLQAPLAVVVTALVCFVVADVTFGRQALVTGGGRLGSLVDTAWTAGLVLLAVAADLARHSRPGPPPSTGAPAGAASELPPAPGPLPYAAALLTLALVGIAAARLPLHPAGGLLFAAIVVVLTVVVRQVVVGREHARLVRLYESAAIQDTLTGALTRRRLLELGDRLTARGRTAVLVIDVDHFKTVNDTHGHLAGDAVLKEVTQRALGALRPGDLLGRYGGDEFVAVLPGADATTAQRVAERLHAAATTPLVDVGGARLTVSLSVGVASGTQPGGLVELIDRADAALYAAKATGRGRVINADTAPAAPAPAELTPASALDPAPVAALGHADLLRAVSDHHLAVHYQPRVDLRSGRVTGAEAFVRWQHPDRGLLQAGDFLPALTDRASLVLLTERVLEIALADCATWRTVEPELRVAVNLPHALLQDPWLPQRLTEALGRAGVAPGALEIEITEDALGDDVTASRVVAELRAAGIRVTVDDFGTGAASLTTLRCHTLDVLKIDPSLLSTRLADPRDLAVIRAIATLGHELGTTVVAEGVEDEPSRDLLARLGVDEVQGHLVSRPVPVPVLLTFLAAQRAAVAGTGTSARLPGGLAHPAGSGRPTAPFSPPPRADLDALLAPAVRD